MCIFHTLVLYLCTCVCVHIGVGFSVACSEQKAMRKPQLAEQQQCRSRFFVVIYLTYHFDMKPSNTNPSYFATYTLQNKKMCTHF